jgi:hypothetical protein
LPIHDQAGAGGRCGVDVRLEIGVLRNFASSVMIEVAYARAGGEQPLQGGCIRLQRDVEHGQLISGCGIDAIEQAHVALDAGHQHARARLFQA